MKRLIPRLLPEQSRLINQQRQECQALTKPTKDEKIAFGEYFPKLTTYPKINAYDQIYKDMLS